MKKELGERLSQNFINKVSRNIYMTNHAKDRIVARKPQLIVENDMSKTINNIANDIRHCKYGFNNDDGSLTIVCENECCYIIAYNDTWKHWNIITYKEPSFNGFTLGQKHEMVKERTKDRNYWKNKKKENTERNFEYEYKISKKTRINAKRTLQRAKCERDFSESDL